jgi:microcystin-dependent protein
MQTGYSYKFIIQTADAVTLQTIDNLYPILQNAPAVSATFIAGMILIWSGSLGSIPAGWVLCDGTNATPDLRDRFVIAAGNNYAVGATGGSADSIVVSHTHAATVTDPQHNHTYKQSGSTGPGGDLNIFFTNNGAFSTDLTTSSSSTGISVSNASAGVSGTGANIPPYYALAYIMKT